MTREPDCGDECLEALARLEAYLDGELPGPDAAPVVAHLADCVPCAERASFEEHVRALLRLRCHDAAPAELLVRVRELLGVPPVAR